MASTNILRIANYLLNITILKYFQHIFSGVRPGLVQSSCSENTSLDATASMLKYITTPTNPAQRSLILTQLKGQFGPREFHGGHRVLTRPNTDYHKLLQFLIPKTKQNISRK